MASTSIVLPATGGGTDTTLGSKYVYSTRFEIIGSGTGGAAALPPVSTVILGSFGSPASALISQVVSGKPSLQHAYTAGGVVVATSFDSSGNWVLTGTPTAYPIAIIYQVKQTLSDFDSTATNIYGVGTISTDGVTSLNTRTGAVTITANDVNLGLVDNTSDASKPVSTAQATAIAAKEGSLGNPVADGYALVSSAAGVRSWVQRITDNVAEGATNLYFTSARALAAITMFTLAKNSAAPNATVPVMSLTANDAATDVDVAIVPKGLGGFSVQVADGTITGGNKRGSNTIDLQFTRNAATQIPTGANAFCVNARNTASNTNAFACGLGTVASGTASLSSGNGSVASGSSSFSANSSAVASGTNSFSINNACTASGVSSFAHGVHASTFSISTRHSFGGTFHATAGDNQTSRWRLKCATTDATATVMTTDGAAAAASNRLTLQLNNVYYFKGTILGKQTAVGVATGVGCWTFSGMVMTGTTAASIILVGTPTITAVSNTGTWGTPTITVDTTNGCLVVTVIGKAATGIRWGGMMETEEVIYA